MKSLRPDAPASLDRLLGGIDPHVARVLDRALSGADVTAEEAETLLGTSGRELTAVAATADHLRREAAGDIVTYVVNRN
ncbi:MAG TPA: 7,8-didemethyl-8-hydroxy-5-deazariboflavin synthase subunit CofH, partial [bacterium]